jgi:hypothetical protein
MQGICTMAARTDITPELLRQLFDYKPSTGELFWKRLEYGTGWFSDHAIRIHNAYRIGLKAFLWKDGKGYLCSSLNYKRFTAHRAAWAIVHGELPPVIDHIDGDILNNKIDNLRAVTQKVNCRNARLSVKNKSGVSGVHFNKNSMKWVARIGNGERRLSLGAFSNFEEAVSARKDAERKLGYHQNHGRRIVSC